VTKGLEGSFLTILYKFLGGTFRLFGIPVASSTVFREPDTNYLQINKRNINQKGNKSVTSVIAIKGRGIKKSFRYIVESEGRVCMFQ
jgi:hypothetical protein